ADELQALLEGNASRVIVTCRTAAEGGRYTGDEATRLALLAAAAEMGVLAVDVEIDTPQKDWPGGTVILSHHDFNTMPADLDSQAATMDASPAAVNKIAFKAAGPEDALAALDVVRNCTKPSIVLAMGQAGQISRLLAGKVGAYGTFAALGKGAESAPGQPTLREFKELYRWDALTRECEVYGVIGCPVGHSLSPAIHNAAFAATGRDAIYVPVLIEPGEENFTRFMDALLARPWLNWRGLSVTIPHKENAMMFTGRENCDQLSRQISAINTIAISPEGTLRGRNTDYAAAIDALCNAMQITREGLADKCVAVLGAGGAARAIVAALAHYGARTIIYNRTLARAEQLADEFAATAQTMDAAAQTNAKIIINCTPIGMHPNVDASPLEQIPPSVQVVFDTIYNPVETKLLALARQAGLTVVSGMEMFVNQAVAQFEFWTDQPAPRDIMRDVVIKSLSR
ncbi:MAG: shikimate dehydrogenase, partial [Planctomycetaceae bacterium]